MRELRLAEARASTTKRLSGLCTLLALMCWLWWSVWASNYVGKKLLIANLSVYLSQQYKVSPGKSSPPSGDVNSASPGVETDQPDLPSGSSDDNKQISREEASRLLAERRNKREQAKAAVKDYQSSRQERIKQWHAQMKVQAALTGSWLVVMWVTAAFMFCAALAGLTGSRTSRKWHRQVVYWTILASLCTVGGVASLSTWGGFPPPDYILLSKIAAAQTSYAFLIVFALLLTRKTTMEWVTGIS